MKAAPQRGESISFDSNGVLTLGVEIELQLVDPSTGALLSRAEELLQAASHLPNVKREFYQNTVEIITDKCDDVAEAERDIGRNLAALRPIAREMGIAFSATGTHPFADQKEFILSPGERYRKVCERNQWLARRCTVYGLHVHLGMASGDDCIRFNNFFLRFLPHFLALSASSPFWQGEDTGLASCRPSTFEAMPTSGLPYPVENWRDFERLCGTLMSCGAIGSLKDLWWDLRPSPGYGTLEIRVCDGPATLAEAMGLAAFMHTLAHWFRDNGDWLEQAGYPPRWLMCENKWRVIRHGLRAELVADTDGTTRPLAEDIGEWLDKVEPYARKLGYAPYLGTLRQVVGQGGSSERQRRVYGASGCFGELMRFNMEEFDRGHPVFT